MHPGRGARIEATLPRAPSEAHGFFDALPGLMPGANLGLPPRGIFDYTLVIPPASASLPFADAARFFDAAKISLIALRVTITPNSPP